jgi:hypothetical protein
MAVLTVSAKAAATVLSATAATTMFVTVESIVVSTAVRVSSRIAPADAMSATTYPGSAGPRWGVIVPRRAATEVLGTRLRSTVAKVTVESPSTLFQIRVHRSASMLSGATASAAIVEVTVPGRVFSA